VADKGQTVQVEIFGQTYTLKVGPEPGYVEELAGLVDQEMREISRRGGAVDSVRIAVLAALNIADQLQQQRGQADVVAKRAAERAARLAQELERAIGE
jgi:cell division protein ZapA